MSKSDRSEYPEYIGIRNRAVQADIIINSIIYENEIDKTEPRRKDAIYIPSFPISERDEILGWYMGTWSRLERKISTLIEVSMGIPMQKARAIASLGLKSDQSLNLIQSHLSESFTEEGAKNVTKWMESFKKSGTKRNRIVHGDWILMIDIGTDENHYPIIIGHKWIRNYDPASIADKKALEQREPKAIGRFQFDLQAIMRANSECEALISNFKSLGAGLLSQHRPDQEGA